MGISPSTLNYDELLNVLGQLSDRSLAACLATSRSLFLLCSPMLWSRAEIHRLNSSKLAGLIAGDASAPPPAWSPDWRLAIYLRSIRRLSVNRHVAPPEPRKLLPWLGMGNQVFTLSGAELYGLKRDMVGNDVEVVRCVQMWVDAVLGLLRTNKGPQYLDLWGGLRRRNVKGMLSGLGL
ncbi:hypothetical protein HK101_004077, partial [Irineochytrium annulatum]